MTAELKTKAERLPDSPGVYLFLGRGGRILYVGKAKSLKKRVASYFAARADHTVKTRNMLDRAVDLDFILTANEKEALILEATLAREHRPRYNIDLKDDKRFPAVRLSVDEPFPNLTIVRRRRKDGAKYFGPFASAGAVRETLRILLDVFPLRKCRQKGLPRRDRACLNFQIGKCLAPCQGYVTEGNYTALVRQVELFLKGNGGQLLEELKTEMAVAADELRYEEAAVLRDRITAVRKTLEKQRIVAGFKNRDVVGLDVDERGAAVSVLLIRNGVVRGSRNFALSDPGATPGELLSHFLRQYYPADGFLPQEVLTSNPADDADLIAEWLSDLAGRRIILHTPERGEKRRLAEMAVKNAKMHHRPVDDVERTLEILGQKLGLKPEPRRIECVDISNLFGTLAVGSVVAFDQGRPLKGAYRRFKLQIDGKPDDYELMRRVLKRRLKKTPLPDLLLVDGGKGQLGVAARVLEDLNPDTPPALAAIAKNREQPGDADRIFIPGRKNPVQFKAGHPALRLLMAVRDEAHRFAVAYHRTLRKKQATRSILDEAPGLGPKRKASLLRTFGSLSKIKQATVDELAAAPAMTRSAARSLAEFLAAVSDP